MTLNGVHIVQGNINEIYSCPDIKTLNSEAAETVIPTLRRRINLISINLIKNITLPDTSHGTPRRRVKSLSRGTPTLNVSPVIRRDFPIFT